MMHGALLNRDPNFTPVKIDRKRINVSEINLFWKDTQGASINCLVSGLNIQDGVTSTTLFITSIISYFLLHKIY